MHGKVGARESITGAASSSCSSGSLVCKVNAAKIPCHFCIGQSYWVTGLNNNEVFDHGSLGHQLFAKNLGYTW